VSAPNSLQWLGTSHSAFGIGYQTLVNYQINRKLGNNVRLPSDVPVNERFPNSHYDSIANNWLYGCPGGGTASAAQFADQIRVGASGQNPSQCNPGACTTVLVDSIDQYWRVGSSQTGLAIQDKFPSNCSFGGSPGRLVQTDKLTRFTDRGDHGNVVSPVP